MSCSGSSGYCTGVVGEQRSFNHGSIQSGIETPDSLFLVGIEAVGVVADCIEAWVAQNSVAVWQQYEVGDGADNRTAAGVGVNRTGHAGTRVESGVQSIPVGTAGWDGEVALPVGHLTSLVQTNDAVLARARTIRSGSGSHFPSLKMDDRCKTGGWNHSNP